MDIKYQLTTPEETSLELAKKVRQLRLARNWKQATLAEHSGISLASLRRFERTGQISLNSLLRLVFALGRLNDFELLLQPPQADSMAELEASTAARKPKRGSR
jgi:transcriptional regulator with XRE-family HTH domain